jgi:hypothetical protein
MLLKHTGAYEEHIRIALTNFKKIVLQCAGILICFYFKWFVG